MLTPKDLKYRINVAEIKMVITNEEQADKFDAVAKDCPSLSCKMTVDGSRPGWISYSTELEYPAPCKYPRAIEFAEALPKTVSGKIK
jgi:acetyl-CoA synthetase